MSSTPLPLLYLLCSLSQSNVLPLFMQVLATSSFDNSVKVGVYVNMLRIYPSAAARYMPLYKNLFIAPSSPYFLFAHDLLSCGVYGIFACFERSEDTIIR